MTILFPLWTVLGGPASDVFASPEASLDTAADGTVIIVGSGWRPGDELVVGLGNDRFMAYTDSSGAFELQTGLATYEGLLSVHHADASSIAQIAPASPQAASQPNPLAVLFAQSLAQGAAIFVFSAIALTLLSLSVRTLPAKRR
jgi:hypothetical protein